MVLLINWYLSIFKRKKKKQQKKNW